MPSSVMRTSSDSPPRIANLEVKSLDEIPGRRATARVTSSAHDMFLMSSCVRVCCDKPALPIIEKLPGVTVISLSEMEDRSSLMMPISEVCDVVTLTSSMVVEV